MELCREDPFLHLAPGSCPCCGYVDCCYGGCRICGWNDCVPLEQIDEHYSNTQTLREAQHFYLRFGCCGVNPWLWAGTNDAEPGTQQDTNWRLFPAPFDGLPIADPLQPLIGGTCPCCGYKTVTAGFHVCEICAWLYCPEQEWPDKYSRHNGFSLRESQQYFAEWGAKHPAYRPYVRPSTPDDVRDPDWCAVSGPVDQSSPEISNRTCPVCGYKAYQRGGGICPICYWPYFCGHQDGKDVSRPNPVTVARAQQNFLHYGAWTEHPLILANVRAPLATDLRDMNWRPASEH